MREWEYQKLDLNNLPRKTSDIDVLCDAGRVGWELVYISPNSFAYIKRELPAAGPAPKIIKGRKAEKDPA
jgi:hypothetical protein